MTKLRKGATGGIALFALLASTAISSAQDLSALEAAAKKEGTLTTIALPHTWCGYGAVIEGFKKKYPGIEVNELSPDASSAEELEAIRSNKGNTGPQAPDVVDVGLAFGPQAKEEGLLQPYKVSTWDEIPDDAKDAEGYWYGDYYGATAFGVNTDLVPDVPHSWADLMKSDYAQAVALGGDPRTGNQDLMSVMAAGLAQGAKPGADSAKAGMDYFAKLNKEGNFVPVGGKAGTIAQGQTPIVVAWDYNLLAWRDSLAGNPPVEVVVPDDGVVAGVYVQAISAYAPHPNAAKLWMEYLYSDEGQLLWLQGYCHPIRFNPMSDAGKIPQAMLDKLPSPKGYAKAVFPSLAEQGAHKDAVVAGWADTVGANVQ